MRDMTKQSYSLHFCFPALLSPYLTNGNCPTEIALVALKIAGMCWAISVFWRFNCIYWLLSGFQRLNLDAGVVVLQDVHVGNLLIRLREAVCPECAKPDSMAVSLAVNHIFAIG